MINFEKKIWYNKNDTQNEAKRIPISAFHLNRIEDGVDAVIKASNEIFSYWWKKTRIIGGVVNDSNPQDFWMLPWTNRSQTTTFYYSDSVSVKADKETGAAYMELDNPLSIDLYFENISTYQYTLRNKYFMLGVSQGQELYYMGETGYINKNFTNNNQYGFALMGTELRTCSLIYGNVEYVNSDKIDAHPDGWDSSDETLCEFLGIPFENGRNPLRMGTGFYVGDGTTRLIQTTGTPVAVWFEPTNSSYTTFVTESLNFGQQTSHIQLAYEGFVVDSHANVNNTGRIYYYVYFY